MSKVVRSVKNVTKGYTTPQIKVRNATSNDPWGPVGSDMAEIAGMTFGDTSTFYEIMDILDKRLNDKGKNWRHVLKSLKVLDYCLHEGSELVVSWAKKNVYIIKTLREFQYIDEDGRDVGQNVRISAKELTSLILDEERLRAERQDRKSWKSRVTGIDEYGPRPDDQRRQRREDDDLEYRMAIEASKAEAEEEAKRRGKAKQDAEEDDELAKALKLSKEEDELRKKELEETNAASLFDDTPTQQPQPTGWNQGYQQQAPVDWWGNLIDQQQPQNTGFIAQPTGYQNGLGYGQFGQGMDQFQNQPTGYMQPQQTAFNMNNPYSNGLSQQPQDGLHPGSNNPWGGNKLGSDSLMPQPTGSNNPFASGFGRPASTQPTRPTQPTLSTLQEQRPATAFNPIANYQAPQQPQPQPRTDTTPVDPHHARLNALLASGEGQDTFGNVGDLRIPAQHTAPGTFVNSAGAGAGRVIATKTGNNPFLQSQFTGMPQTNRVMPAQTGPAGAFGGNAYGGGNPFGQGQGQQQQQQSGSLIDL